LLGAAGGDVRVAMTVRGWAAETRPGVEGLFAGAPRVPQLRRGIAPTGTLRARTLPRTGSADGRGSGGCDEREQARRGDARVDGPPTRDATGHRSSSESTRLSRRAYSHSR